MKVALLICLLASYSFPAQREKDERHQSRPYYIRKHPKTESHNHKAKHKQKSPVKRQLHAKTPLEQENCDFISIKTGFVDPFTKKHQYITLSRFTEGDLASGERMWELIHVTTESIKQRYAKCPRMMLRPVPITRGYALRISSHRWVPHGCILDTQNCYLTTRLYDSR